MSSSRKNLERSDQPNTRSLARADEPIGAWIWRQVGSRQACGGHISVMPIGMNIVNQTHNRVEEPSCSSSRESRGGRVATEGGGQGQKIVSTLRLATTISLPP